METIYQQEPLSFDKVWQALMETRNQMKETDQKFKETGKMIQALEKSTKKLETLFITQWGKLMESLITPSCLKLFSDRGLDIRQVFPNVEIKDSANETIAEFDIILANGADVVIVEVKTTMNTDYVKEFIEKLATVKELMPQYKDKNIFGAVAGIKYDQGSAKYAARLGLYVIVNRGEGLLKIANVENFVPKAF